MIQSSTRAAAAAALLLFGGCSFGIKANAGYAQFDIEGDIALSPSGGGVSLGTVQADVENDLGLDETMGTPYGRIEAEAGIVSLTLSGFLVDQSGTGTLSRSFGDISFGTTVNTDVEIGNLKAAALFNLLDLGFVRVAPGLGVNVFDLDLQVRAPAFNMEESLDEIVPVPMVFAQAEVDVGIAEVVADVGGSAIDYADFGGTFLDLELFARVKPIDHFELFAGLRYILIDVDGKSDDQDFLADLSLAGWMIGGGVRF